MKKQHIITAVIACSSLACSAQAANIAIVNSSFEDTTGQSVSNEFTFGIPTGWTAYDPSNIIPNAGVFPGTLEPNGVDFFNTTAPDGNRVGILFNSTSQGDGEYGFIQTLGTTLSANTSYSLTAQVGNIASGNALNGAFFNLDEFPGYRVELLAGGVVIALDNNSLTIPEAEFSLSTVNFITGAAHAQLGQDLAIRLVNTNIIPDGFTQATSPDLEVDFDDIQLTATPVPEPSSILLSSLGFTILLRRRRA